MSIKKFISIGLITCMGVGICYNNTYALDDSFLKFLINSSYPEAKVEISNDNKDKKDAEKITDKKENEENTSDKVDNKDEDEFIKMYVGEENMPTTQVSLNSMTKGVYISNPLYTSNILTTSDKPQILIYHTHGGETYSNSPEGNYHSEDKPNSTLEIGAMLTQELASRGRSIVHNTTYHDLPDFNSAYTRSLKTIQNMQAKYGSIDIVIDLHRDGRDFNKISKEEFHNQTTTTIDGKDVAKFLFVVGEKSKNSKRISEIGRAHV